MANTSFNKIKGSLGEEAACRYLKKKGFKIKHRNYSCKVGEIDIIALKDKIIHFVEVKSRSDDFIIGRFAVNNNKQKHIKNTANYFLNDYAISYKCICSFDVIEITDSKIDFLENCFY